MTKQQLEARVLEIVDRVVASGPVEDSFVELKAEWDQDHHRAARQIAGHANAARGAELNWVFGVNEKAGTVPGATLIDLENWWPQVQSRFEGLPPDLTTSLNVTTPHGVVAVLEIQTDRAPYLVKNPHGGQITQEVPWREGTSIRTARRQDLLRLLVHQSRKPDVDFLSGSVQHGVREPVPWLVVRMDYYFVVEPGAVFILPDHRIETSAIVHGTSTPSELGFIVPSDSTASRYVRIEAHQAIFTGPGPISIQVSFPCPGGTRGVSVEIMVVLHPLRDHEPIRLHARVQHLVQTGGFEVVPLSS